MKVSGLKRQKGAGTQAHIFSDRALAALLLPLVIEQFLNSMMGTADTIMVSNVGSAAISAASLVDSLNILVIQVFSALAAGGTIICSQYLGSRNEKEANRAAGDVRFSMVTSTITMWLFRVTLCVILCRFFGFGPMAVWIGMFTDWTVRAIVFTWRFFSGKWAEFHVIP